MAPGRALGAPRRGRGRVPVRRSQPRGSPWAPCLRRAVEKGSEILARARKARPETTNGPGTALRGGGALGRPPGPSQPRRGAAGGEARGHPALRGQHPQPEPRREDAGTLPEPQGRADSGANPPLLRVAPLGLTEHRAEPEHTLSPSVRCCPPALTSRLSRLASMLRAMLSSPLAAAPAGRGPLSVPYRPPPPRGQPPPGSSPTGGTGARPRAALCPPGGGWRGAQPSGGGCPHRGESPLRGPGQPGSPRSPSQPGVGVGRQGRSCRCPASRGLGAAGHRGRCEC